MRGAPEPMTPPTGTKRPRDPGDRLTVAPVDRALFAMSAPISLGMLSTFLFQVVDTWFVGRLGTAELAALSFSSAFFFLLVGLFIGLSVGASSLVARALGEGDASRASRFARTSVVLAAGLASVLAVLGLATIGPAFAQLGASAEILPLIGEYMGVLYLGMPLLAVALVGNAAVRATGWLRAPELLMGAAGVLNLVLDYLLIFGAGPFPRLEIQGAALATVISWGFVAVSTVVLLVRAGLLRRRRMEDGSPRSAVLLPILRLSAPTVATQVLTPLTAVFVTFLAAKSGAEVVAALGIATRIELLGLVGISSVSVALVPFVAQNFGARNRARVDEAIVFAGKASFYWGGLMFVALVLGAGPVARMFSGDETVQHYVTLYFWIVAISYAPAGLLAVTSSIFNGVQIPGESLRILMVKTFAFTAPLASLGALFGAVGLFAAVSLANVLGGVYAARTMRRCLRAADSDLARRRPVDDYIADWRTVTRRLLRSGSRRKT